MDRKVKCSIIIVTSFIAGYLSFQMREGKRRALAEEKAWKNASIVQTLNIWMKLKQRNQSLYTFFEKNQYHEIAIYGMHYLGERLKDELQGTDVIVKYAIDRNAEYIHMGVKTVKPEDKLEEVDAIIVTPVFHFEDIERQLSAKVNCPIIALDDVINNA